MQCIWREYHSNEIIYSIPSNCFDVYCAHSHHIAIYIKRVIYLLVGQNVDIWMYEKSYGCMIRTVISGQCDVIWNDAKLTERKWAVIKGRNSFKHPICNWFIHQYFKMWIAINPYHTQSWTIDCIFCYLKTTSTDIHQFSLFFFRCSYSHCKYVLHFFQHTFAQINKCARTYWP